MTKELTERIFSIRTTTDFTQLALDVFRYQVERNSVYRQFCRALKRDPDHVSSPEKIPFLPVGFFNNHQVTSFTAEPEAIFSSSGTSARLQEYAAGNDVGLTNPPEDSLPAVKHPISVPSDRSHHYIKDLSLYVRSFTEGFRLFYGNPADYCILALLPSYLERDDSSLVYMAKGLMDQGGHPDNGFYQDNLDGLANTMKRLLDNGHRILLLGVSFALLDLAEAHPMKTKNTIIMETGGMKGRRRELIREELHAILAEAFCVGSIHSEYGMTELLSQAYSQGGGLFSCPPWMRVLIRDSNDPLTITDGSRAGGINIIDLANLHSCSFLATHDLGKIAPDGRFEVLGRFDNSDIRGCNLMAD